MHKKGDPSVFSNHRPVSLKCIPCRVMERVIKDVMMNYLTVNNIISPSQHAFQKGHSTGFQRLECLNDWTAAVESGQCIYATLISLVYMIRFPYQNYCTN